MSEKYDWVCTDPDCAQYRRCVSDKPGEESFELIQVQEIPGNHYIIAHATISVKDIEDEREELMQMYDYSDEYMQEMPRLEAIGILAECFFETYAFDNLEDKCFNTYEKAEKVVKATVS